VLARAGRRGWHVSVLVVGDAAIRALNRRWRRHDRATDVLSFPAGDGPGPARLLGDVVISAPRAALQAKRFGVTFDRELQRLLVHGILHLMGFDHMTAGERRTMRAEEERLLGRR
jgi:probable rRNA maturation factor